MSFNRMSFFLSVMFLWLILSCQSRTISDDKLLKEFMELRKEGETEKAYNFLSDSTKKVFSEESFKSYCFVYRVIDYQIDRSDNGYFTLSYSFYDKKFKKDTGGLHTFYISENREKVKVVNKNIVFPHVGFVNIRKFIENKDIDNVRELFLKMVEIDPYNDEIKEIYEKMGFSLESEND